MHIKSLHIKLTLDHVEQILDHYRINCLAADDPHRSMDDLKRAIEAFVSCKVRLLAMPEDPKNCVVHGMFVKRQNKEFDICFVKDLAPEWKRFVMCKELFHILIDQEQFHQMELEAHVEEVVNAFTLDESRPHPSVQAEFLAEIAAMEFMFPWTARKQAQKDQTPVAVLAQRYGIPLFFAERFLSKAWIENLDPSTIAAA